MPYMPSIFSQQEEQALEDKLLEIAQPQTKQAQAAPADPNAIKALARKLADKLGLASSVSMDKPTSLYMRDLQSLDSLISFLNINGVKYAEKFIVQPDYNKIPEAERAAYVPYKWAGGIDAMPMGSTVAIYKDGLVGYLKSIQQKADASSEADGQLLTTMIGKLIDSANATLKTKIDHEALKTPKAVAEPTLLYATALDSVNETLVVENPLVPGRDKGAIKVTPKDLKSKMDFDDFARQLKVSKGGKVFDYEVTTSETFFCDIINVLHARAVLYANRRGVYLDRAYLQMITDLAGQYQCSLTITPSGGAAVPTPVAGQISPRALSGLANLRPFNSQYINFQEITTFLDRYVTLKPTMAPLVNQVKDSIGEANRVLGRLAGAPLQMDNLTTTQVRAWTNQPIPLMNYLYTIISVAGRVYTDFLTEFRNVLGAQAAESVEQQITSGGPQQINISTILRVRESLMSQIPQGGR